MKQIAGHDLVWDPQVLYTYNIVEVNEEKTRALWVDELQRTSYTCILAFLGNCFVLVVLVFGKPNFHRIYTVLLSVIATSDLLLSCTAYPLTAISGFHKRWIFDDVMCILSGFIVYFLSMTSINTLCVLAISRYIIVCKPDYEHILGKSNIKWLLGLILFYALFWTGSPLAGWSSYTLEPFKTSCTLNWAGKTTADVTYNTLCIVFCYCIPVAIFVFCYYNVVKTTSERNLSDFHIRTNDIQSFESGTRLAMELTLGRMARRERLRDTRRMTLLCLAMVVSFFVIWTPYAILTVWNIAVWPTPAQVQILPTMFAKLSCAINPFLYCFLCERFREAAKRLIRCPENQIYPD